MTMSLFIIMLVGEFFEQSVLAILVILPILVAVAFFTLLERKVMAAIQRRQGPNVNGIWGFLQPLIDGLKLIFKEIIVPARANFYLFLFAPVLTMILSFLLLIFLPFSYQTSYIESNFTLLLLFTISSFNVYSLILAGWASNSKYALLGAVRSIAQMLSYELILSTIIALVLFCTGSLRLIDIVMFQERAGILFFPLFPVAIIFFITLLAETNRVPFDLAEAESELVAGYNVEYSSILFSLFFLGEYCAIIVMSFLYVCIFFGGWILPFNTLMLAGIWPSVIITLKTLIFCFIFILIRATIPRYRFDQLMILGWHTLLPVAFGFFIFIFGLLLVTDSIIFPSGSYFCLPYKI